MGLHLKGINSFGMVLLFLSITLPIRLSINFVRQLVIISPVLLLHLLNKLLIRLHVINVFVNHFYEILLHSYLFLKQFFCFLKVVFTLCSGFIKFCKLIFNILASGPLLNHFLHQSLALFVLSCKFTVEYFFKLFLPVEFGGQKTLFELVQ